MNPFVATQNFETVTQYIHKIDGKVEIKCGLRQRITQPYGLLYRRKCIDTQSCFYGGTSEIHYSANRRAE